MHIYNFYRYGNCIILSCFHIKRYENANDRNKFKTIYNFLHKNKLYKNNEAEIGKKIRIN